MDDYNRGAHSKYSLKVHLIFVTKYRKKLFLNFKLDDDVKQYLYEASIKYKCSIIQMETDTDHVHMLISYSPDISIVTLVKLLKQYSAYNAWNSNYLFLKKQYWKHNILWSEGYFACSIGQVSSSIIETYIKNQG